MLEWGTVLAVIGKETDGLSDVDCPGYGVRRFDAEATGAPSEVRSAI